MTAFKSEKPCKRCGATMLRPPSGWRGIRFCRPCHRPNAVVRIDTRPCVRCGADVSRPVRGWGNPAVCGSCRTPATRYSPFEEIRTDKSRRDRLLKERGHRCERCSQFSWMGRPIPLELHHADGNFANNAKGNLQLLCPNCHAQTPSHKNKKFAGRGRGAPHRSASVEPGAATAN